MWYINTKELKKNDAMFERKWMELKVIKVSKISQTQKDKYHMPSLTQEIQILKDVKVE
jgi:hypothetical protein